MRHTGFNSIEESHLLDGDNLQRHMVIKELIETEKKYTKQLDSIIKDYLGPLRRKGFIKTGSPLEGVEACIKKLKEGQKRFLKDLKRAEPVLDVFLLPRTKALFDIYSTYIDKYNEWAGALKSLKKNKKAKRLLSSLDDPDLLFLAPVQRPPRYLLLLQELKKSTPVDHPNYQALLTAIDQVKLLVQSKNTSKQILNVRIHTRISAKRLRMLKKIASMEDSEFETTFDGGI